MSWWAIGRRLVISWHWLAIHMITVVYPPAETSLDTSLHSQPTLSS